MIEIDEIISNKTEDRPSFKRILEEDPSLKQEIGWEDIADEDSSSTPEREICEDAISRQYLIDKAVSWDKLYTDSERYVSLTDIQNAPPVTPQPKEGHWIDADGDNAICGCCNRLNHLYGTYCKHCGAKMHEP